MCFECGAKFYDLNKPDPLCPKCGVDQRNAPKQPSKLKRAKMLDEDEEEVELEVESGELELGLGVVDSPDEDDDDDEEESGG